MNTQEPLYALIVAGGSGSRMGKDIPKQFLHLGTKPILIHTLHRYLDYSETLQLILVLPATEIPYGQQLIKEHTLESRVTIVAGGTTRFQSVKNGLNAIEVPDGLVAIHDGVRPFVTQSIIHSSYDTARKYGSAIAAVPLKDSIRYVNRDINRSEDRSKFRLIQTPQTFQIALIKKAFQMKESADFTDDASVLEANGHPIFLIEGAYENIKITTPDDLLIAEAILKNFTY